MMKCTYFIDEAGYPTRMIKTRHPGQVLYRDDFQIVARPEPRTPTMA